MQTKLVLVRHGQSLWDLKNRFTGWQDIDLTDASVKEEQRAGEQLKAIKIDIVYTLFLLRAKHTYQIIKEIAGLQNLPVIEYKVLNERG